MGKPWHYTGRVYGKQLLCRAPGDGAGEVCHGKHAVWQAGAYGKAHKRRSPFRTVKGSCTPYTWGHHGQGAGGACAGRGRDFHPCWPFRKEFQLCRCGWESILPGKFTDEPGGTACKDHGACPWNGKAPGYHAGTDQVPDGGRKRWGSGSPSEKAEWAVRQFYKKIWADQQQCQP